jgi:hypothetical protein
MIEVNKVIDVHSEVPAVGVNGDDERPDQVKDKEEDAHC